jgi:flavin-dependent dehydrogenase
VSRPRILLVPELTELEWTIKPLVEKWAEVASFDAPGVGSEPKTEPLGLSAIVSRGLAELDRRCWDRCIVVGDEFGSVTAVHLGNSRPAAIAGLALGHPFVSFVREGPRRTLNLDVMRAFSTMLRLDYRTYARHYTQITQGAYDDELAERFLERVPQEVANAYRGFATRGTSDDLGEMIRTLKVPVLLAKHEGCLGWTEESFEEALKALPSATTLSCAVKPSASPEFASALRLFAEPLFD